MFTQSMPGLARAMSGAAPDAAVRQLMQALGNCNQPLEHRGPISLSPGPPPQAQRSGVYLGDYLGAEIFGDGGVWNPTTVFGSNFTDLQNFFAYNAPGFGNSEFPLLANTIDARWFPEIFNNNAIFNNQSFVDANTNNNHFGGDGFLFNNDVEFVSNVFPTTVVMGQPGAPGPAGPSGRDGLAGLGGVPGRNGLDGSVGLDGRDGFDGAAGAAGAAGAVGGSGSVGAAGRPGRPGIGLRGQSGEPGRPGEAGPQVAAGPPGQDGGLIAYRRGAQGGYRLTQAPADALNVRAPDIKVLPLQINVPVYKYTFNTETCKLDEEATIFPINETIKLEVEPFVKIFLMPPPKLAPKPTWP